VAITISLDVSESLSLEAYLEHVRSEVDLLDVDSVVASAPKFRALMNNRKLITDVLNRQLQECRTFQAGNRFNAQTFMLGGGPGFFVRANIWPPPSHVDEIRAAEEQYFSYLLPHDHNFTFMTGGYSGAGYRTTIYEYDHERLAGVRGEPVQLRFLEKTTLPSGKIMLYRKSVDAHTQEHPTEFSISINLVVVPDESIMRRETLFIFDVENGRVKDTVDSSSGRVTLCEMARSVGDDRTAELLDALIERHPDPKVRGMSIESLAALRPDESERAIRRAADDSHSYVRHLAVDLSRSIGTSAIPT
jgi:hypothetical protein